MTEPTYLLWTPRIVSTTPAVRFNVTALSAVNWPSGPQTYYEELLADMGVECDIESWEVMPFRSRYHGDPEASDWRDRWKRNWRVTVRCAAGPRIGRPFEEGYETRAFSAETPVPDGNEIHVLVLADFASTESAAAASAQIEALVDAGGFELIQVERVFWQLQIDLGPQPQSFFTQGSSVADRTEEICRRHGGWPTFDERIAVLG